MSQAVFTITRVGPGAITIRDCGGPVNLSVTNDAERVVRTLVQEKLLREGMRLFYYDSEDRLDEILWRDRKFQGFAPGPDIDALAVAHDPLEVIHQ
jgi:hypothetical protein